MPIPQPMPVEDELPVPSLAEPSIVVLEPICVGAPLVVVVLVVVEVELGVVVDDVMEAEVVSVRVEVSAVPAVAPPQ